MGPVTECPPSVEKKDAYFRKQSLTAGILHSRNSSQMHFFFSQRIIDPPKKRMERDSAYQQRVTGEGYNSISNIGEQRAEKEIIDGKEG